MKKCFYFIAIYVIILMNLNFISCKPDSDNSVDINAIPDINAIANYSKYSSIGIGNISTSVSRLARTAESDGYKIIGKVGNDSENEEDSISDFEVVDFISSSKIPQDFYIGNFRPIGSRFIIFQFSRSAFSKPGDFSSYSTEIPFYLLDKTSGKIFKIPVGLCPTFCYSYFDISDDAIFSFTTDNNIDYSDRGIYKFSIGESDLIIEKIVDDLNGNAAYITVDRYGNIFTSNANENLSYLITTEKKLRKITTGFSKSLNGYVYTEGLSHTFNSTGEEIDAVYPFQFGNFQSFIRDEYRHLIKKDELTYYYANWDLIDGYSNFTITKVIFEDENKTNFTSDSINFGEYFPAFSYIDSSKFIITDDKIYFLTPDELFYFSLSEFNGIKHTVVSDYIFKTISTDGLGNIYFTAISPSLENVNGFIEQNGNIKIDASPNNYNILYISAIN